MLLTSVFLLLILIALGVPIAFALILSSSIVVLIFSDASLDIFGITILSSINSYVLLAIPFFILTGELANRGNLVKDLITFTTNLLGWFRGGVALAITGACIFFAGITGSTVAEAAAILPVTYPIMRESGHPPEFSASLIGAASTFGILIPPSVIMILYGNITQTPVDKLFMAGVLPGAFLGGLFFLLAYGISWRYGYGLIGAFDRRETTRNLVRSLPVIAIPFIVMAGIYSGLLTPTEVAAFVAVYTLALCFIRRSITLKEIYLAGVATVRQTAMIYLILVGAMMFAFILISEQVPQTLVNTINDLGLGPNGFLLAMAVSYVLLGCFFDGFSLLLMTVPVLFPTATALGVDPFHLAVVQTVSIQVAVLTPPVGMNLFVVASITNIPMERLIKGAIPFILALMFGLVILILSPFISTWLPSVMY